MQLAPLLPPALAQHWLLCRAGPAPPFFALPSCLFSSGLPPSSILGKDSPDRCGSSTALSYNKLFFLNLWRGFSALFLSHLPSESLSLQQPVVPFLQNLRLTDCNKSHWKYCSVFPGTNQVWLCSSKKLEQLHRGVNPEGAPSCAAQRWPVPTPAPAQPGEREWVEGEHQLPWPPSFPHHWRLTKPSTFKHQRLRESLRFVLPSFYPSICWSWLQSRLGLCRRSHPMESLRVELAARELLISASRWNDLASYVHWCQSRFPLVLLSPQRSAINHVHFLSAILCCLALEAEDGPRASRGWEHAGTPTIVKENTSPAAAASPQIQPRLIQPKVPHSWKEALKCPGEAAVIQLAMPKFRIMYYVFLTRVCMRSMRSNPSAARSLMNAVVKPERDGNGWGREHGSGQGIV